jgi:Phospholipase_D-nuclease N-terminal
MHPYFAWLPHGMDWAYLFVFFVCFGLIGTFIWIAALVSCLKNESSDNTKIVWVLVILLTHCLGGVLYFLVRRPQRLRELGH